MRTAKKKRPGGVGARARAIREAKKLSQQEVAAAMGMSSGDLCNLEKGRRSKNPGAKRLLALADALGVTVEELVR